MNTDHESINKTNYRRLLLMAVLSYIAMFVLMYTLLTALYVFLLNDKVQHGPEEDEKEPAPAIEPSLRVALRNTIASDKGLAEV